MYDVDIMTGGNVRVFELGSMVIQVKRGRGQPDESPNGHTDADSQFVVLAPVGKWISNHPVPLHTEAGNEENRAVHVSIEEAHKNLTQRLAVNPIIALNMIVNF